MIGLQISVSDMILSYIPMTKHGWQTRINNFFVTLLWRFPPVFFVGAVTGTCALPYLTRAAGLALDTLATFGLPTKQRLEMLGIPLPDWPITGNQFLSPASNFQLGHTSWGFSQKPSVCRLIFSETFFCTDATGYSDWLPHWERQKNYSLKEGRCEIAFEKKKKFWEILPWRRFRNRW